MIEFGDTVTVLRAGEEDRYGDFTADVSHTVDDCVIAWDNTTEPMKGTVSPDDARTSLVSDVTLFMPVGADVRSSDKIRLPDGDVYRVVGKPARWKSPFSGWQPGVVVNLQRIEG